MTRLNQLDSSARSRLSHRLLSRQRDGLQYLTLAAAAVFEPPTVFLPELHSIATSRGVVQSPSETLPARLMRSDSRSLTRTRRLKACSATQADELKEPSEELGFATPPRRTELHPLVSSS